MSAAGAVRWRLARRGGREVALLAYPLILEPPVVHDPDLRRQALPDLVLAGSGGGAVTGLFAVWSVIALFTGTGEYLTTFVAQYLGAGRPERIGPALWQGIYFSLGAGLLVAALSPLAGPVFDLAGHDARAAALRGRVRAGPDAGRLPGRPDGDAVDVLRRPRPDPRDAAGERLATVVNVVLDWC